MTIQFLNHLNRRLADTRGRTPDGKPVYQWVHSATLTYPCRVSQSQHVPIRQVDEDCWLIAKWMAPPPESEWKAQYPDIGYPANGIYYATDIILREGVLFDGQVLKETPEPNEAITEKVIRLLKMAECKTFRDCLEEIEVARSMKKRDYQRIVSDCVEDAATAFDNLPGARGGHVSFGGID